MAGRARRQIDDREVWAKTNPSLGSVVREERIVDELAAMNARPDVFRRERLGEWGRSSDTALALDAPQWAAGARPRAAWGELDPRFVYERGPARFVGIDSAFGNELASVVEAVPLGDGVIGLDVLTTAGGVEWIAAYMTNLRTTAGHLFATFDPLRVGALEPDLRAAGLREREVRGVREIEAATSRDLTLACAALVRAVREGRGLHDARASSLAHWPYKRCAHSAR